MHDDVLACTPFLHYDLLNRLQLSKQIISQTKVMTTNYLFMGGREDRCEKSMNKGGVFSICSILLRSECLTTKLNTVKPTDVCNRYTSQLSAKTVAHVLFRKTEFIKFITIAFQLHLMSDNFTLAIIYV